MMRLKGQMATPPMSYLTALALALAVSAVTLPASEAAGKANPSVSGQAKLMLGGELRTLSVNALWQKDDTVAGQAEVTTAPRN